MNLIASGSVPSKILHLWAVTQGSTSAPLGESLDRCFNGPLALAQSLAAQDLSEIEIAFVTSCLQQVGEETVVNPARAVVLGPARVIPKELPGISCRSIDVDHAGTAESAGLIVAELNAPSEHTTIATSRQDGATPTSGTLDELDLRCSS